jgi:signal transduction histidine kinase/ligand-binding sensor domain-containing protein/DNA-binding response OmpR family regulator
MRVLNVLQVLVCKLLLLCSLGSIYGQDSQPRIKFYTLDDGLSQVTITDLIQDKSGFIWLGTQDGLNRFDGQRFKHYKYNELDSTSISCNSITKLLGDPSGNVWIGTLDDGLNYYNHELDLFHRIQLGNTKNESVTALEIEENGTIWAASRNSGLHRLQPIGNGLFDQDNYLNNKALSALLLDGQQNLWIGGFKGEVLKWNLAKGENAPVLLEIEVQGNVQAFYRATDQLLIGTDTGLFIYDLANKQVEHFELNEHGDSPTKHITEFLDAGNSKVWVGTGSGLFLFDWKNAKVLQEIKYNEDETPGLSNNTVHSLLQISENQIFVGTANNLDLLDFKTPYFNTISKNKRGEHLLNDNVIFSIFKDQDRTWIGTSDGGLNLITNGKTYYFKEDQNNPLSISGNVVREIQKDDKNQRLWLATTRGLSMIDLKSFDPDHPKFKVFNHDPNSPGTINNDFIKGIALDKEGNVWGATFGHGIFRLTLKDNESVTVNRFKSNKNDTNSIINDFTQCIVSDSENNIWIGSQGGLTRLSLNGTTLESPTFTNYSQEETTPSSISANSVYDITIDSKDQIWVATHYGLNLFLGDGKFKSWADPKQNTDGIIYCLQADEDDNLWLGTTEGIVKYNPQSDDFKFYSVADGIQSKEFDIHAKFRDDKGNIYLGGVAGVTYFHPENLNNIDQPESLYFSQLRIKDEVIRTYGSTKKWLSASINRTESLQFNHDEFPFYLNFSSVDYRLHKDVEFAYKLLPTDTEWNVLKDPEIQFLNLPAGDYTLQVNGFSRGEEWEQAPLEMNLEILPPWWGTWWSYLIYLAIAITFADRFYRFQLSKKLAVAESERLREVSELKSGLYTNITHEFRTPLTVILGMTKELKSNLKNNISVSDKSSLSMIERNGENLLGMVNEMLDLAKLENQSMDIAWIQSDIIPLIKYLVESFHSLAATKNIALTVYNEEDLVLMDFDSHKISSIISNLISNALKFTPEKGKIIVHTHVIQLGESTALEVKIKDSGNGIAPEDQVNIFNRFYQVINERQKNTGGTGIGLALCKELIELLGGSIKVKSSLGRGSEFYFQLPIHNTAQLDAAHIVPKTKKVPTSEPILEVTENGQATEWPLALLIEDNHDVAHYLKSCLKNKYETIHASDGEIGIETALDRMPDIIICDVMMPKKDGYEVCKTLKNDSRTDHIPIIMLTAKVTTQDRLKGLSQGADAYLTKPFEKAELFTRIEKLILLRKKLIGKLEKNSFSSILKDKASDPQTKFIQEVVKVILDNLDNTNFGSLHLARELHLSESHIYRKLKTITDKSTAIFIRSVRLQKAKESIQSTNKTISEIAYEVGFNDPSWFSRSFKEEFGYPPSEVTK